MRVYTMCKGYIQPSLVMYTCYTQSLHFGEMKNMFSLPKNLYKKVYLKSHCTVCFNSINTYLYTCESQSQKNTHNALHLHLKEGNKHQRILRNAYLKYVEEKEPLNRLRECQNLSKESIVGNEHHNGVGGNHTNLTVLSSTTNLKRGLGRSLGIVVSIAGCHKSIMTSRSMFIMLPTINRYVAITASHCLPLYVPNVTCVQTMIERRGWSILPSSLTKSITDNVTYRNLKNIFSITSHYLHMLHTNPSILSLNPIIPSRNSQNLLKRGV